MKKFKEEEPKKMSNSDHLVISKEETNAVKADKHKKEFFMDFFKAAVSAVAYGLANNFLPIMQAEVVHYAGAIIVGLLSVDALGSLINFALFKSLAKKDAKRMVEQQNNIQVEEQDEEMKRGR